MCGVAFITILLILTIPLYAPEAHASQEADRREELARVSGAEDLYRGLDREARDLLDSAGAGEGVAGQGLELSGMWGAVSRMLRDKLTAPVKALAALLGVCVLCRLAECLDGDGPGSVIQLVGAAACGVVMAGPVVGLIAGCQRVTEAAAAFLTAAAPVYAGLLIASGSPVTGSGYSLLAMGAGGAIPVLACGVLLPLTRVYLGLSLASAVSGAGANKLAGWAYRFGKWALVMSVTLFTGILSVQTAVNSQADAAAVKAAKLAISTGVPIVGGALGDAVGAIRNSVHIVKSGVGAFGVLAGVCVCLPVLMEGLLWLGVCVAGEAVGEMLGTGKLGGMMSAFGGAVRMALGVLASVCAVCVASAAAVVFAGG